VARVALQEYCDQARTLIDGQSYDEAIAICRHILRRYPKHIRTYQILGEACLEKGETDEAINVFSRLLDHADPENFSAYAGLGIAYERKGLLDEAIWHMERAFELASNNEETRNALRRLYSARDGHEPERIRHTKAALARLYSRGGQYRQAIEEFRRLLASEENQSRMDLRVSLIEPLWRDGRREQASEQARQVLQTAPDCLKAILLLGEILIEKGRHDEAAEVLAKARPLDPENKLAQALFGQSSPLPPQVVLIPQMEKPLVVEPPPASEVAEPAPPQQEESTCGGGMPEGEPETMPVVAEPVAPAVVAEEAEPVVAVEEPEPVVAAEEVEAVVAAEERAVEQLEPQVREVPAEPAEAVVEEAEAGAGEQVTLYETVPPPVEQVAPAAIPVERFEMAASTLAQAEPPTVIEEVAPGAEPVAQSAAEEPTLGKPRKKKARARQPAVPGEEPATPSPEPEAVTIAADEMPMAVGEPAVEEMVSTEPEAPCASPEAETPAVAAEQAAVVAEQLPAEEAAAEPVESAACAEAAPRKKGRKNTVAKEAALEAPPSTPLPPLPDVEQYKLLLQQKPKDEETRLALARAYRDQAEVKMALEHYGLLARAKPKLLQEAIGDMESIVASRPDNLAAHELLADLYTKSGQLQKALDRYRWILQRLEDKSA